jgi:hypothetical protein
MKPKWSANISMPDLSNKRTHRPTEKNIEKVAKALYDATKGPNAGSWETLVKWAKEEGGSAEALRQDWLSIAIASIDLANGARYRSK